MKNYDVVIIGAGTAGLSARREVAKQTDNYLVIDDGPLGTTCARVGCMPSKVLIEVANSFYQRKNLAQMGISGGPALTIDHKKVMAHVRSLRDRFVRAVKSDMNDWTESHLLRQRARFLNGHTLIAGNQQIKARRIIIATGSRPIIPEDWQKHSGKIFDTDSFFELETLPPKMVVIGLGVIGLELGQALSRLGVDVTVIGRSKSLGGLSDPSLLDYGHEVFAREFSLELGGVKGIEKSGDQLVVKTDKGDLVVDAALAAMGRRPNLDNMGLDNAGVVLNERGYPQFDKGTYRVKDSNIYIAGDVMGERAILHEAADEGRVAGFNSVRFEDQAFKRRTAMGITFTDPNIAYVGQRHQDLRDANENFVVGKVSFEGQGRAIVKLKEVGGLHVYANAVNGRILGAEIFAPDGEHLAHLIAWAIEAKMTLRQALSLPFYHPVIEEGLRTALRHAASQISGDTPALEVMPCPDTLVGTFAAQEG